MNHPKMQYTYVGIDSHKDSHTAVFMDCFFEKLGEMTFENLPSKFPTMLEDALKYNADGTTLMFGMEDISLYGRSLTVFLKNNGQAVRHVNALLVARERKNRNITQKTDSVDAECAARVLLSKLSELPDAQPHDDYWMIRTLVIRRNFIVKNNGSLKNHLHELLMHHYPNYRSFFDNIDCKTSLAFFARYPSPGTLRNITYDDLYPFLYKLSNGRVGTEKTHLILNTLQDTSVESQYVRDAAVQSTIRQLEFNQAEIKHIEVIIKDFLPRFDTTLTTMNGIDIVLASQLLSCIGDIRKFATPAKLARYSGIAPVTYASGKKDLQFANQRGSRELNSLFYKLAVLVSMSVGSTNKVINPFFYDYYRRKQSEGKTKRQALKCVQRRLVNIIWGMLTYNKPYENPEMYCVPKKDDVK